MIADRRQAEALLDWNVTEYELATRVVRAWRALRRDKGTSGALEIRNSKQGIIIFRVGREEDTTISLR